MSPDGASVYVTNFSADGFSSARTTTGGGAEAAGPGGRPRPAGIAVSRDGQRPRNPGRRGSGTVRRFSIDAERRFDQATVGAGSQPRGIAAAATDVSTWRATPSCSTRPWRAGADELAPPAQRVGSPSRSPSADHRSLDAALFAASAVGQYDVAGDGMLSVRKRIPPPVPPQSRAPSKPRATSASIYTCRRPPRAPRTSLRAPTRSAHHRRANEGGRASTSCTGDVADGYLLDLHAWHARLHGLVARRRRGE